MTTRLPLTQMQAAYIAHRVGLFDSECPETWRWQSEYVRRHGALPLFLGWTEILGLRPDGALVRWSEEPEHGYAGVEPIDDPNCCALAVLRAAQLHPMFARLMPRRPPDVPDCRMCGGTGCVPNLEIAGVICECLGLEAGFRDHFRISPSSWSEDRRVSGEE